MGRRFPASVWRYLDAEGSESWQLEELPAGWMERAMKSVISRLFKVFKVYRSQYMPCALPQRCFVQKTSRMLELYRVRISNFVLIRRILAFLLVNKGIRTVAEYCRTSRMRNLQYFPIFPPWQNSLFFLWWMFVTTELNYSRLMKRIRTCERSVIMWTRPVIVNLHCRCTVSTNTTANCTPLKIWRSVWNLMNVSDYLVRRWICKVRPHAHFSLKTRDICSSQDQERCNLLTD